MAQNKSVLITNTSVLPEDKLWFSSEVWLLLDSSQTLPISSCLLKLELGHGASTSDTTTFGLKERSTSFYLSSTDSIVNSSVSKWSTSRLTGLKTLKQESATWWVLPKNRLNSNLCIVSISQSETTPFLMYINLDLVFDCWATCPQEPLARKSWEYFERSRVFGSNQPKQNHLKCHARSFAKYWLCLQKQ